MDTPTIAAYYKEPDPMKRRKLLEQSIAEQEDPEANEIRQKIWEMRYHGKSAADPASRADCFLGLWMVLEFNKNAGGKMFGRGRSRKEILRELEKTGILKYAKGNELERELIYREVLHMVRIYADLCEKDKTYGSSIFGIFSMKEADVIAKLKADLYETAICLPYDLALEEELELIVKAGKAVFELKFPEECPLPDPAERRKKRS